jgi:hypothetical protein
VDIPVSDVVSVLSAVFARRKTHTTRRQKAPKAHPKDSARFHIVKGGNPERPVTIDATPTRRQKRKTGAAILGELISPRRNDLAFSVLDNVYVIVNEIVLLI